MEYYELELKQQIDIKLIRLNKPKFNNSSTPYYGEYLPNHHLIDSNNDNTLLSNDLLLKNFNLTEILPNNNLMTINNTFGKVLFGEKLEACILIINMSNIDDMKIKEVVVKVSNDPLKHYTNVYKKCDFVIFEENDFIIPCGKFYSTKINFNADNISKYSISIDIKYCCNYFNNEYIKNINGKIIKTMTQSYYIEQNKGLVVKKFLKKMLFDNNLPFKIKEKLVTTNLGKTFIEINLINSTSLTLHIVEYSLEPNKILNGHSKESFKDCIKGLIQGEELSLEAEDEFNFIYEIDNHNLFQAIENFTFKVSWVNLFDSIPKHLVFIIKNKLINDIISISNYNTPNVVYKDEIFQMKLLISNIHRSK